MSDKKIEEILTRGVSEVIDRKNLEKRLRSGKKLRIKLGIDPTSPYLHLGRSVQLLKLRDFQQAGHQIIFIIGDFTGVIGDTSDKDAERPMLSEKEIQKNMKTYVQQCGKILDMKKTKFVYNSTWLSKLRYKEICEQANIFSLAEFSGRENIRKRLDQGKRVSLREMMYPLMQGYDSVVIKADVEIAGSDQRFNVLAGRTMQGYYKQEPQDVVLSNIIVGLDGRKMSSSWGNTINLLDEPKEMFGKVMSMRDDLIISYFIHCTRVSLDDVRAHEKKLKNGANPRDIKMILAHEITKMYWGEKKADEAEGYFMKTFRDRSLPSDIKIVKVSSKNIVDILVETGFVTSKGEARRLIAQHGVKLNGHTVESTDQEIKNDTVLQKGKRHFLKVVLK